MINATRGLNNYPISKFSMEQNVVVKELEHNYFNFNKVEELKQKYIDYNTYYKKVENQATWASSFKSYIWGLLNHIGKTIPTFPPVVNADTNIEKAKGGLGGSGKYGKETFAEEQEKQISIIKEKVKIKVEVNTLVSNQLKAYHDLIFAIVEFVETPVYKTLPPFYQHVLEEEFKNTFNNFITLKNNFPTMENAGYYSRKDKEKVANYRTFLAIAELTRSDVEEWEEFKNIESLLIDRVYGRKTLTEEQEKQISILNSKSKALAPVNSLVSAQLKARYAILKAITILSFEAVWADSTVSSFYTEMLRKEYVDSSKSFQTLKNNFPTIEIEGVGSIEDLAIYSIFHIISKDIQPNQKEQKQIIEWQKEVMNYKRIMNLSTARDVTMFKSESSIFAENAFYKYIKIFGDRLSDTSKQLLQDLVSPYVLDFNQQKDEL